LYAQQIHPFSWLLKASSLACVLVKAMKRFDNSARCQVQHLLRGALIPVFTVSARRMEGQHVGAYLVVLPPTVCLAVNRQSVRTQWKH